MRKATQILVFNLFLNGAATVVDASGLAEDLGVNPTTGASRSLQQAAEAGQQISSSSGIAESLFSLVVAAIQTTTALVQASYAAPQMFNNLGFPVWATTFIFAPIYLFGALALVHVATGRGL